MFAKTHHAINSKKLQNLPYMCSYHEIDHGYITAPLCSSGIKNSFQVTDYLQGQTTENIVDMLTVIREGSSGFGETAECSP